MDAPANRLELNRVGMDYAPLWFQHTQYILIYSSATLWSLAYVFYIRQAFRDQSYGMPIFSLCANITWEAVYGLVRPPSSAPTMISTTWMVIDLGLVYATLKFGPREWQQAPLVARNLSAILWIGCLIMLVINWCFTLLFDDDRLTPCFWSAFGLQVIVSWAPIAQLISRGNTRGHSMMIWFLRFTGTHAATAAWLFRAYYYPAVFDYAGTHLALCLYGLTTIGDLLYPVFFRMVKSGEKMKTGRAVGSGRDVAT